MNQEGEYVRGIVDLKIDPKLEWTKKSEYVSGVVDLKYVFERRGVLYLTIIPIWEHENESLWKIILILFYLWKQ